MRRAFWVSAVGISVFASLVLAKPGVLKTRDGRTLEGEITDTPESMIVKRGTIEVRVAHADVASVRYTETADAFTPRINELKADDTAGRITLAREAFRAGQYSTARKLADEVLAKEPNNKQAVDLLDTIRRQIMLEAKQRGIEAAATQEGLSSIGTPLAPGELPHRYLNDAEINRVRQTELQEADAARVRVRLDNGVARRFMEIPQATAVDFASLSPFQQALMIIRHGDADMRKDVIILSDPGALRDFRLNIQPIILRGCASAGCHGSQAGGPFVLFPSMDNEPAAYTNFYMLATYKKRPAAQPDSIFGGSLAGALMLDRQAPERSLVLTYGLPVQQAGGHPHPVVPNFRPTFTSVNDPTYRRVGSWIADVLINEEPVYGISYQPPVAKPATTQATTKPATKMSVTPVPTATPVPAATPAPAR